MNLPTTAEQNNNLTTAKQLLNKVPEVTIYFWIVKILCTTVGETAADYLNMVLKFGLTGTSLVMSALLVIVLLCQFKVKKYVPSIYWLVVVLVSIVGTLITDSITDTFGVSLEMTTIAFSFALAITFFVWHDSEHTVSIHSIVTQKREAFYWLAILFTFALGTAAGDLTAEKMHLGYLTSIFIFAGLIVLVTIVHFGFKAILGKEHKRISSNAVVAFWIAYVLTRPLGASIGDYFSQAHEEGGLGLGTIVTSAVFLIMILATVIYLAITKKDVIGGIDDRKD